MIASPRRSANVLGTGLVYVPLVGLSTLLLIPLVWTLSTSLKTLEQLSIYPPNWIPDPIAWWNYPELFRIQPLLLFLRNTLVIVLAWEIGSLITCSLVAYGFARLSFPGRDVLFVLLLSTLMMPYIVRLIPLFIIYTKIGWIGTFLPLTVPILLARNPFYIFLLRQFFRGIPNELSDAARIDGCSELGIWWRIVMPLSGPVLAAVGIFAFQAAWDEFLGPLIYLGTRPEVRTLAVALYYFRTANSDLPMTHYLMAMSVLMILPILIVFAAGQRYFVRGVTLSGLKG